MIFIEEAFHTLEIEPTDNIREVKKAYAAQVKKYHPEEYPQEWKRIHDAYETALTYARGRGGNAFGRETTGKATLVIREEPPGKATPVIGEEIPGKAAPVIEEEIPGKATPVIREKPPQKTSPVIEEVHPGKADAVPVEQDTPVKVVRRVERNIFREDVQNGEWDFEQERLQEQTEGKELQGMFEELNELASNQREQMKKFRAKQLNLALQRLTELATDTNVKSWEEFFYQQDMEVLCHGSFLYKWGDILLRMKFGSKMRTFFQNQIQNIEAYCIQNDIRHTKIGALGPVDYVKERIKAQEKGNRSFTFRAIGICVLLFIFMQMARVGVFEPKDTAYEEITKQFQQEVISRAIDNQMTGVPAIWQELYSISLLYGTGNEQVENALGGNANVLQNGMRMLRWDTKVRKNDSEYEYVEIWNPEEIGDVGGRALTNQEYYAVKIWTTGEEHAAAICFEPKNFGLNPDCKIYYRDETEFKEIKVWDRNSMQIGEISSFSFGDYRGFPIWIPKGDENNANIASNAVTVVFVNP